MVNGFKLLLEAAITLALFWSVFLSLVLLPHNFEALGFPLFLWSLSSFAIWYPEINDKWKELWGSSNG